jgi:predicted Zn-dependent protease
MLGKEMARKLEQSSRLIKDPVINDYINQIGQKIVRNSDAKVPFTIKVIAIHLRGSSSASSMRRERTAAAWK